LIDINENPLFYTPILAGQFWWSFAGTKKKKAQGSVKSPVLFSFIFLRR